MISWHGTAGFGFPEVEGEFEVPDWFLWAEKNDWGNTSDGEKRRIVHTLLQFAKDNQLRFADLVTPISFDPVTLQISSVNSLEMNIDVHELEFGPGHQNKVSNISALADIPQIKGLYLSNSRVRDFRPFQKMKHLESLDVGGIPLTKERTDLLSRLVNLKNLYLSETGLNDLEMLRNMRKLEYLDLSNNPAEDLTPISKLIGLRSLVLSGTFATDLNVLDQLENLEELDLRETDFEDLTPLLKLPKLRLLELTETSFSAEAIETFRQAHPNRDQLEIFTQAASLGQEGGRRVRGWTKNVYLEPADEASRIRKIRQLIGRGNLEEAEKEIREGKFQRMAFPSSEVREAVTHFIKASVEDLREGDGASLERLLRLIRDIDWDGELREKHKRELKEFLAVPHDLAEALKFFWTQDNEMGFRETVYPFRDEVLAREWVKRWLDAYEDEIHERLTPFYQANGIQLGDGLSIDQKTLDVSIYLNRYPVVRNISAFSDPQTQHAFRYLRILSIPMCSAEVQTAVEELRRSFPPAEKIQCNWLADNSAAGASLGADLNNGSDAYDFLDALLTVKRNGKPDRKPDPSAIEKIAAYGPYETVQELESKLNQVVPGSYIRKMTKAVEEGSLQLGQPSRESETERETLKALLDMTEINSSAASFTDSKQNFPNEVHMLTGGTFAMLVFRLG